MTIDWTALLNTSGVAVVILVFIGVCVWRVTKWVGVNVVKPINERLITRAVKFFDELDGRFDRVESAIDHQTKSVSELAEGLGDVRRVVLKTESVQIVPASRETGHAEADSGR